MDTESLTVAATTNGRSCILTLTGDLDLTTATELMHTMSGLVGALDGQADEVVLDLAGLAALDVGGARALMTAVAAIPDGHRVTVRSISPIASRLLRVLGWSLETPQNLSGPVSSPAG
jgi:anti-anti-sigma factor